MGAGFDNVNFAPQRRQFMGQMVGEHLSKKWPYRNAGEEVARPADMRLTVIAMFRMIQREFHEARKSDNARASDLVLQHDRHRIDVLTPNSRIQ